MILKNAKLNNKIVDVKIENGIFTEIGEISESGIDLCGKTVIPGLIDIHTHGCVGCDTIDGKFEEMSIFLAKNGTTSWLPTTMTVAFEDIKKALNADTNVSGAKILGFHMEGPYISKKYKGAQNESFIKKLDINEFNDLNNLNKIKIVTIAPELEGSIEFIKHVNCVVSLGHTACNYDESILAIESGANCLTHTFNAMPPLHHREPALIGAAVEKNIYAQVICDGEHVHKASIIALYKMFGSDRLVLISDSMGATGLKDNDYDFGGQTITVKNSIARTQDGALAGSTLTLLACVKKSIEFGVSFQEAIKMATETPAKLIGVKKGKIEVGYDADLLVVDEKLNILDTYIMGEKLVLN